MKSPRKSDENTLDDYKHAINAVYQGQEEKLFNNYDDEKVESYRDLQVDLGGEPRMHMIVHELFEFLAPF